MFRQVAELMYFVPNRLEAANWYAQLFEVELTRLADPDHFYLQIGGQEVWFHQADCKVYAGTAGCVPYWQVEDFDRALERAIDLGALLYRGPLDRQDGTYMCQVKDPFGNLMGMVGPKPG